MYVHVHVAYHHSQASFPAYNVKTAGLGMRLEMQYVTTVEPLQLSRTSEMRTPL